MEYRPSSLRGADAGIEGEWQLAPFVREVCLACSGTEHLPFHVKGKRVHFVASLAGVVTELLHGAAKMFIRSTLQYVLVLHRSKTEFEPIVMIPSASQPSSTLGQSNSPRARGRERHRSTGSTYPDPLDA